MATTTCAQDKKNVRLMKGIEMQLETQLSTTQQQRIPSHLSLSTITFFRSTAHEQSLQAACFQGKAFTAQQRRYQHWMFAFSLL
jgi:hypothetical protein